MNAEALEMGREYAKEQGWEAPELQGQLHAQAERRPQNILGNEAVGAGAIVAGCRVYAGYPITPASEVLEYMAEHISKFGGAMIQADSEMAAAHHVIGAAVAGARSMTATSGPGFSLMQEAISAAGITETPMVIVLCTRGGPGYRPADPPGPGRAQRGHLRRPRRLRPHRPGVQQPEDGFYIMEHVFNLAERYQCPVFLLLDQMLAQSSYTVPSLDPSGFNIDRGKLLSTEQFRRCTRDNRGGDGRALASATRSPRTASPTAPSPARPA